MLDAVVKITVDQHVLADCVEKVHERFKEKASACSYNRYLLILIYVWPDATFLPVMDSGHTGGAAPDSALGAAAGSTFCDGVACPAAITSAFAPTFLYVCRSLFRLFPIR